QELVTAIEGWQWMHKSGDRPFLYYSKAPSYVTVYDGRNPKAPTRRRYEGVAALVIEICNESAKSTEQIRMVMAGRIDCSDAILRPILNDLTANHILYEERGKYFSVAIPENPYL
ncbi:MAG: RiPP maturation radical SAM protein 1, partial [Nitrospira sp.]|nr:RiPP maturation radical SAM protein 1 [Nitrospira sp.]